MHIRRVYKLIYIAKNFALTRNLLLNHVEYSIESDNCHCISVRTSCGVQMTVKFIFFERVILPVLVVLLAIRIPIGNATFH